PRLTQPPFVQGPSRRCFLPFDGMGGRIEVRQEVEEIEDGEKTPRQQVKLEEVPVVLLAVANVALPLSPVEATALHLGGHLPAEFLAVGHARHHRAHQFAGSSGSCARHRRGPTTKTNGWMGARTSGRRYQRPQFPPPYLQPTALSTRPTGDPA